MRRPIFFHACGAGIAFLCGVLSLFSFWIDPAGQYRDIVIFLAVLGGMAVYYAVAVWGIVRGKMAASLGGVLVWAGVFRLILFPSHPILETDFYRYLWDGFVLSNGVNPYLFAPAEVLDSEIDERSPERADTLRHLRSLIQRVEPARAVLSEVNNPTVVTIYPPFAQIAFGASAAFSPLSLLGWKTAILFFDAVLIAALATLLPRFGRDPRWVLIYAWSPLVLKETANTAHFDVIASAAIFLAILFALAGYKKRSAAAWMCGTLAKLYPALAIPLWVKTWDKKTGLIAAALCFALVIPFSGAGVRGLSGWAEFSHRWESNSSLVAVLETGLVWLGVPAWGNGEPLFTVAGVVFGGDAFFMAKSLCAGAVLALASVLVWKSWRLEIDNERRLRWTFLLVGAIFLASPVCNPWYLTGVVPFLCFYPRLSWLYFSIACLAHYTIFIPDPWGYLPYVRELEYLPFFALLAWEWRRSSSGHA